MLQDVGFFPARFKQPECKFFKFLIFINQPHVFFFLLLLGIILYFQNASTRVAKGVEKIMFHVKLSYFIDLVT